jgi:predicted PurR-regulated permease PerM
MPPVTSDGETPLSSEYTMRANTREHFSATLNMEHWTRLLIVVTTFLLLLLAVAVTVRLMSAIGHTLLIFSLGGLLAYALDPLVELIHRKLSGRRGRMYSVFSVFAGLAALLALSVFLFGHQLAKQVTLLGANHVEYEAQVRQKLDDLDLWLADRGVHVNLQEGLSHPPPNVRTWGEAVARSAAHTFILAGKDIVEGLIVLLVALYFLIYSEEMREGANHALPEQFRLYVEQWQDDINRILGGFVRGQLLLALIIGALAAAGCFILGIKVWLLIGLFVVIAALIPVVGPFLGAIPAVIAAAITPAGMLTPVVRVALVIVAFGIINEVGSKILYPRLVGAALGLHEVLVLFILFAGYEVSGLTGVLFAAPLTALSSVTLIQLYRFWQGLPPISVANMAKREGREKKAQGTP